MRSLVTRARKGGLIVVVAAALVAAASQRPLPLAFGGIVRAPTWRLGSDSLPRRLSDAEFWSMVTSMSESGGYFRSDNLVSNEITFQYVIPELQRTLGSGGVYLGVGPDQNFTYIVALQPRLAFVLDIRRGNLLQHLMYKALIEMSTDRADFLSRLFSRPRPAGAWSDASIVTLLGAFDAVAPDSAMLHSTLETVRQRLVELHGFALQPEDFPGIRYILTSFFDAGPNLTYSFGRGLGGYGIRGMPTYGELMVQTDADSVERGYLANESNFRRLRQMQRDNLIVPVVGDFGGPHALRSIGSWLHEHEATVSAIYTSNVEQYLFGSDDAWRRYYTNLESVPTDARSTFVRAVFNYGYRDPGARRRPRSVTMLSPVQEMLAAVAGGDVQSYWDVIRHSRSPVEPALR